ncbi:tyrosine-type recombinase/integrase [Yaniella sp.]|uniref:tyrosine-type recombinase/integrase n=1 Tax=Yaniella sp. TaxID=2773929 RepID=UPI002647ED02|nr:tyrosine-type recombinase/integrase [Yaniella sp.]MDN6358436.1 tyrosine-type recombinase/integrase [Yaniella sp.]
MKDVIEQHLQHLADSRYANATLYERERVLRSVPGDILSIDRKATVEWWESRLTMEDGTPRTASSLSQEASHFRRFFRWAMQQDLIERNPADWLPDIRKSKPAVRPVPEGDLHRLMLEAPDNMRRMIALAAMAGMRSAEVGVAKWSDIDREGGVIYIELSKGNKGRTVPLSAGLLSYLGEPEEGYIAGKRMTGKAVSQAVGRYMRSKDVDLTAHKLRARYLTRFLAATGDLAAAAEVAGHADLSSIGRYVVASSDTMRRGAEAAGRIG